MMKYIQVTFMKGFHYYILDGKLNSLMEVLSLKMLKITFHLDFCGLESLLAPILTN